jgi:hypothetical protein
MIDDEQPRQRNYKRLWIALAALAVILAILFVPPFLSVSRYKARITQLLSTSLGRPVRLSSVEVRLLPRPGFLLTDLTVAEDPAYGVEPVLHANTVTASIRLLSLWRGRLELDSISVDEASLNLVRTPIGRWNLDSLFRSATAQDSSETSAAAAGSSVKLVKLPYLEATNSRIHIKSGDEKLPFSLLDAKFSLSQQSAGDWRIRLRGQPTRTDLTLEQADTGEVRLDAKLHQAPMLRQMPVHIDVEWREAQLGQLTRLLLGTDAGWRGNLTGELQIDGTAEAAQIKTRLRATGVHRAEFAPADPMDFDANCSLLAHFSSRAIDNLLCDSPIGSGRVHLTGELPGAPDGQPTLPHLSLALDRIPVSAVLDALRTVRVGLAPELKASGTASGKLTYAPVKPEPVAVLEKPAHTAKSRAAKPQPAIPGPLTGTLTVDSLQLSGNGLSQPILLPKVLLEAANQPQGAHQALTATVVLPAGGATPLTVSTRLAHSGYQITVHGQASVVRGRELAHLAGIAEGAALDSLAGDPVSVDLTAEGPWSTIQSPTQPLPSGSAALAVSASAPPSAAPADTVTGTVTLTNANWKADYLANHVVISQATLHLTSTELRWDPVVFSYGPVKGTATLTLPTACALPQACQPSFQVQFGALDASVFQAAFLGAREKGTLLSTLIDRFRTTSTPPWPKLDGTVKADSLVLGPLSLRDVTASLSTLPNGASISAFDAALLGGRVHGSGSLHTAATAKDKPSYALEGQFEKLSPPLIGHLLGQRWNGGSVDGNAKIELSGFTGSDLADSAKGALHFEWPHGAATGTAPLPAVLSRFDRWSADGVIANGNLTLQESQVKRGVNTQPVQAAITLTDPPKLTFAASNVASEKH